MTQPANSNYRNISQTVISGTLGAPWLFTLLLVCNIFLLGYLISKMETLIDSKKRDEVELRLLQLHMQDLTATMIREGLVKSGDAIMGPTSPRSGENKQ